MSAQQPVSQPSVLPVATNLSLGEPFFGNASIQLTISSGLSVLVGPNASGKTQVLRALTDKLRGDTRLTGPKRFVRFLSAGRGDPFERFRARSDNPNGWDQNPASVGHTSWSPHWWQLESVTGDFLALDSRPDLKLKVEARLQAFFGTTFSLGWTQQGLRVEFRKVESGHVYYANHEASGLLQLVPLLASLYNDQISALMVDEPEISLHPQLQAFLLDEIKSVAGDPSIDGKKLVIIATHSSHMLPIRQIADLTRLVFFSDRTTRPLQIATDASQLKDRKLGAFVSRMAETHKVAFFARNVILVEGPSDEIVTHGLASFRSHSLLGNNAQLVPVTGKGQFPDTMKLFKLMGRAVTILSDLDAIADDNSLVNSFSTTSIGQQTAEARGHASLADMDRRLRADLNQASIDDWTDIESIASRHRYWKKREQTPESVAKLRAILGTLLTTDEAQLHSLSKGAMWLSLRKRLVALLDALESANCFVLRRGTIEDYYASVTLQDAKPGAAANEVASWATEPVTEVERRYADVVRCLEAAAPIRRVNENSLLRQKLGAALGSLFQVVTDQISDDELNAHASLVLGGAAPLFKFENKSVGGLKKLRVSITSPLFSRATFPIEIDETENLNNVIRQKLDDLN